MNAELKEAFSRIKPVCDILMVCPTPENIGHYITRVSQLKTEAVEGLQQYILFPLITHIKYIDTETKHEMHCQLVDAMRVILERVTVSCFEMCLKIETGLLSLIFDNSKPGMIAEVPEELKHSIMKCMTVLMLRITNKSRETLMKTQMPLLAQAIFVSVHIAKLEKLRALRIAAINCVTAHAMTHPQLTKDYHIRSSTLEIVVVDTLSSILPGVLAAMQDVATCPNNPGHAVIVASIDAVHRILCVTMHDKHYPKQKDLTVADFAKMIKQKMTIKDKTDTEVSNKGKNPKIMPKRSLEWYSMAGDKLLMITNSLINLQTHEHYKVRKEIAVYCSRVLFECTTTMQPSIPVVLDVLISLSKDDYPEVSEYSTNSVNTYFASANENTKAKTLEMLCDNFFATLTTLPRIMNNIDSARKLSALNLVHGYVAVLSGHRALSLLHNARRVSIALAETAALHSHLSLLTRHADRDVMSPPPSDSPWCKLRHMDSRDCERCLQRICQLLGAADCAQLLLDQLLEQFHHTRDGELVYIMNWMAASPNSSASFVKRILDTYIEESVWYLPLEVGCAEPPLAAEDSADVSVYDPRAWSKETVPDLYEGTVETRYTDISYRAPRAQPYAEPNKCATLAEAQRNVVLACLLSEGVGVVATRLAHAYQPYLLKTLCLLLERVGSKYEMLHLAGLKAINDVAVACGHTSVAGLIKHNADYFTNQVTVRLKKAWNCQSALQILSVVMEYSDSSILDYLYGIVQDVLVQSCDKYYERDLQAYLQVFLAFVECIRKWYLKTEDNPTPTQENPIDVLKDLKEFIASKEEEERLMSESESKSAEEMYREDSQTTEDVLVYDDKVTEEKPPLPQHTKVTVTILKRCLNYVVSSHRDNCILALVLLNRGLPLLSPYEDELLPLVHLTWSPLVALFEAGDPVVLKRAFDLLVTMAELSKDFIRSRAVKEVLPHIYKFLHKSWKDSYLKDVGSAYRSSRAFQLQLAALAALPRLVQHLRIEDQGLDEAMACVDAYLSRKQPKPLQVSAVEFFKSLLEYDYCAAWSHLRQLCANSEPLQPPPKMSLETVLGTPYKPTDVDYEKNIQLIFEHMVS